MKRRYKKVADGEPRVIGKKRGVFGHELMCCDCGLVHKILLQLLSPRRLEMRAWRDNRATAARRRRQ